jgi:hypothetical protein
MAGRLTNSGYIKLSDVPALVYELTGVRRCHKSVYNWVKNGRADTHGTKVILRTVKRFSMLYTRREWLDEFIEKVG